jgi:hypothetical protein
MIKTVAIGRGPLNIVSNIDSRITVSPSAATAFTFDLRPLPLL